MIDELVQLLGRQADAAATLEGRLRALELLVAADEGRFVAAALDEVETASDRLSALELARNMTLVAAGFTPEVAASELAVAVGHAEGVDRLEDAVEELRIAVVGAASARERATTVLAAAAQDGQARLQAAELLTAV